MRQRYQLLIHILITLLVLVLMSWSMPVHAETIVNESMFIDNTTWRGNLTVNYTRIVEEIWLLSGNRSITSFNIDGANGDVMSMPILFYLTVSGLFIYLGFKTGGRASIPFFLFAGLCFTVLGLYIESSRPFPDFGVQVSGMSLTNIMAMYSMFGLSGIMFLYPVLGEYTRRRAIKG